MTVKEIVSEHTRTKMEDLFRDVRSRTRPGMALEAGAVEFEDISDLAHSIWYEVRTADLDAVGLVQPEQVDQQISAHAVNRAALAMRLARDLELEHRVMDLGIAAIVCDLGMLTVSPDLLLKPGPLDPREMSEVRLHVQHTLTGLQGGRQWTAFIKTAVAHHHEREDGSGYPNRLSGSQIHPLGRLLAAADVYAALVSDRPYRQRWAPHEALEYLVSAAGFEFNGQVIEVLYRLVPPYPVGSEVCLSTGATGLVARVPGHLKHRPVVRLTRDEAGRELPQPREIDLTRREHQNLTIVTAAGRGG